MKYWNKSKDVRLRCWTCVRLYNPEKRAKERCFVGDYNGWSSWRKFDELKLELQRQPSKGKFYMDIMVMEVWFERARDATWFTLTNPEEME